MKEKIKAIFYLEMIDQNIWIMEIKKRPMKTDMKNGKNKIKTYWWRATMIALTNSLDPIKDHRYPSDSIILLALNVS